MSTIDVWLRQLRFDRGEGVLASLVGSYHSRVGMHDRSCAGILVVTTGRVLFYGRETRSAAADVLPTEWFALSNTRGWMRQRKDWPGLDFFGTPSLGTLHTPSRLDEVDTSRLHFVTFYGETRSEDVTGFVDIARRTRGPIRDDVQGRLYELQDKAVLTPSETHQLELRISGSIVVGSLFGGAAEDPTRTWMSTLDDLEDLRSTYLSEGMAWEVYTARRSELMAELRKPPNS